MKGMDMSMNNEVYDPENHPAVKEEKAVREACALLHKHGLKMARAVLGEFEDLLEQVRMVPDEEDLRWRLEVGEGIAEHFEGGRPVLTRRLVVGRKYALTPGQRSVLRDWYGLTPTKLVEVTVLQTYACDDTVIRTLVLRSDIHVEEQNRKHVLVEATISNFGRFMTASAERTAMLQEARVKKVAEREARKPRLTAKARKPKRVAVKHLSTTELTSLYGI